MQPAILRYDWRGEPAPESPMQQPRVDIGAGRKSGARRVSQRNRCGSKRHLFSARNQAPLADSAREGAATHHRHIEGTAERADRSKEKPVRAASGKAQWQIREHPAHAGASRPDRRRGPSSPIPCGDVDAASRRHPVQRAAMSTNAIARGREMVALANAALAFTRRAGRAWLTGRHNHMISGTAEARKTYRWRFG